jgi:DNA-nicking Smr family endonuclease
VRSLSAEERELWEQVAATIRPLSREPTKSSPERAGGSAKPVGRAPSVNSARAKLPPPPKKTALSTATLDGTWDRRLQSGTVEPDRVIDLHGLNLDRAWAAIDRGLERAITAGDRVILLVTGHARSGDPPVQRGKIRAAVHDWLEASRHASQIASVRGAHRRHGGGGSLYIILRRNPLRCTIS